MNDTVRGAGINTLLLGHSVAFYALNGSFIVNAWNIRRKYTVHTVDQLRKSFTVRNSLRSLVKFTR